jgi:hypothetical protein
VSGRPRSEPQGVWSANTLFGPAHGLTPPLRVGTRDEARRGPASPRSVGRPPSDGDQTARESVPMMAPECQIRGRREASRDCNA